MLVTLILFAWFAVLATVVAICQMAARADAPTVRGEGSVDALLPIRALNLCEEHSTLPPRDRRSHRPTRRTPRRRRAAAHSAR
jgi:hypothetical protein